jgi:putative Mg2+ transporter-C (MgtC) family protein
MKAGVDPVDGVNPLDFLKNFTPKGLSFFQTLHLFSDFPEHIGLLSVFYNFTTLLPIRGIIFQRFRTLFKGVFNMFTLPELFYDLSIFSIAFRLLMATLAGGIIGLERGANRHPAGFRTHILVCLGATLAMLTNQYIIEILGIPSDPARLGAQVITGVGFLGVGTIFVTGRSKIKGLTTAAGLWASASLGLAIGIGFYSGALIAGILIFTSLALLPRVESYFYSKSKVMDIYLELESIGSLRQLKHDLQDKEVILYESSLSKLDPVIPGAVCINIALRLPKGLDHSRVLDFLNEYPSVYIVEEV